MLQTAAEHMADHEAFGEAGSEARLAMEEVYRASLIGAVAGLQAVGARILWPIDDYDNLPTTVYEPRDRQLYKNHRQADGILFSDIADENR